MLKLTQDQQNALLEGIQNFMDDGERFKKVLNEQYPTLLKELIEEAYKAEALTPESDIDSVILDVRSSISGDEWVETFERYYLEMSNASAETAVRNDDFIVGLIVTDIENIDIYVTVKEGYGTPIPEYEDLAEMITEVVDIDEVKRLIPTEDGAFQEWLERAKIGYGYPRDYPIENMTYEIEDITFSENLNVIAKKFMDEGIIEEPIENWLNRELNYQLVKQGFIEYTIVPPEYDEFEDEYGSDKIFEEIELEKVVEDEIYLEGLAEDIIGTSDFNDKLKETALDEGFPENTEFDQLNYNVINIRFNGGAERVARDYIDDARESFGDLYDFVREDAFLKDLLENGYILYDIEILSDPNEY